MKIILLHSRTFIITALIATLLLFSTATGFAAVKTWTGGTGTTLSWSGGSWSPSVPVAGDDVVFNTAGTLTFTTGPAASITLNSITVSAGTVTLGSGVARTLTIGGATGVDISIASGATLNIGGGMTIALLDAATTTNFIGIFGLSGGAFTTAAGSTVTYSGAGQNVIAATYSNLTLSGSAAKSLLANTTVNGILTIDAGVTLAMGTFTIGSPTSLVMESGASGSAITGSGLITLGGNITVNYTGSGTTAATIAPPVALGNNRGIDVANASGGLSMSGIISGATFGITKNGLGTLTLSGVNTYTGVTTIALGIISVATIGDGGVAGNLGAATSVAANLVIGGGTLRYTGVTASSNRNYTFSGGANGSGGPYTAIDLPTGGVNLTLSGGCPATTSAVFKLGPGTLTLNGVNSFSGDFVLGDGNVVLGNPAAFGAVDGKLIILNGGVMELATNTTVNAYPIHIGGVATLILNRATAGPAITHTLGNINFLTAALLVVTGANVTSGTAAVQFNNLTLWGDGVLNPTTTNVTFTGTAVNDGVHKFTKSGAGTLFKTGSDWDFPGDFEINGGTYSPSGVNTNIAGNWINDATFTPGTSTITFNGTTPQTIGGTVPTTFNNLVINNTAGVSLAANQTVNASLTLTNGLLTIPANNTLTVANANPILGGPFNATRHIVTQVNTGTGTQGFLQVNNMTASLYAFPVGDATNYLPVSLTPNAACGFRVCSFSGITDNGAPNGAAFSPARKSVCVDAVWTVNLVAGAPSVSMTTNWPASLEGTAFGSYTGAQIGIAHWDNPNWGVCNGTGDNSANTATRSGVTVFSPFGVGRNLFVLPIVINYFNASKGSSANNLNWQVNCSSSDVSFEVERSSDGRNFNTIHTVTATAANCSQPFNYADNTAPGGTVYYRLKSTDVTGKIYYSLVVKLASQQKDIELIGLSPNPVVDLAQLKLTVAKTDQVELTVINVDGKTAQRNSLKLQPGTSTVSLDLSHLSPGLYLLKGVFADGQTNSIRFIKQ